MKLLPMIFIISIVLIHGLIHLMGFLKAYEFIEFDQIKQDISRSAGLLWLVSAILFLVVVVLILANNSWWWLPALAAVTISQVLIIMTWQDAKFGTVANVIILLAAILAIGTWQFNYSVNKEIASVVAQSENTAGVQVSQQRVDTLPSPVRRWLSNIGMVGKNEIHSVTSKQTAFMKLEPSQKKWYRAKVEQYITINKPAFLWKVEFEMFPFVDFVGRDLFIQGDGQMKIKIASLVPVVNVADNEKVNESTLQRYLLELPWYPSAALSPYIKWKQIDEFSAEAVMDYNGVSGSATYHFDREGNLEKVSAFRYKDSDAEAERLECIGEVIEISTIDGIEIPTKMTVSWMLEKGKFTWYKLEVEEMELE